MCSPIALTVSILYPTVDVIAICIILYVIINTIQQHRIDKNELLKPILWIYVTAILYLIIRTPVDIFTCIDQSHPLYKYPKYLRQVLYPINWICLIWLLYKRILHVFNGSLYKHLALSQKSQTAFKVLYFSMIIIPIICLLLYLSSILKYSFTLFIAGAIFILSLIILSIWLMILFGYKLNQLLNEMHQITDSETTKHLPQELLKLLTRYFILSTVSLSTSIASLFMYIAALSIDNDDVDELLTGLIILDVFTNAVTTYLQNTHGVSNRMYYALCGYLDKCCKKCLRTNERNIMLQMNNTGTMQDPSGPTGASTTGLKDNISNSNDSKTMNQRQITDL